MTLRLTVAQALFRYLQAQHVERDGVEQPFFGGCLGIFGHGNVAGVGQALQETGFPYYFVRNEQAGVHAAVAWARARNRLGCMVATSSIGPGATNMVTGAALATVNRLPVLLLPGDTFSRRTVAPVLQQLESDASQDVSVNDCFRPVSRYWDRVHHPEQLLHTLPEAVRVLTSPVQTGAVTLCLPQDVQAAAWDWPEGFFAPRTWHVPRPRPDVAALGRAVALLREARRPLIVAGGGVIYADATAALQALVEATGIPVALTQAGKGSLPDDHPLCLGAVGVTGTAAANDVARTADVVVGVGTRWSDFTTASKTAFQAPDVRFVNMNVAEFDAAKHGGVMVVGDARATLAELGTALGDHRVPDDHALRVARLRAAWTEERARVLAPTGSPLPSQAEILGALNAWVGPRDVIVNAAGSGPGDLHKYWSCPGPGTYHVEYGYSCMGYEIPAGLGIRLADPTREVFVLVGDGTWLMMPGDLTTLVQERVKVTVILIDNHGFGSIQGLSRSVGSEGFGTVYRVRGPTGAYDGPVLPVDLAANAASLGATTLKAVGLIAFREALRRARENPQTTVIVVETDRDLRTPGYDSWWDVPVAEVSSAPGVQEARQDWEKNACNERVYHAEAQGPTRRPR